MMTGVYVRRDPVGRTWPFRWLRPLAVPAGSLLLALLVGHPLALQGVPPAAASDPAPDSHRIYALTNIWTLHLTFTADQWKAMEPPGGGNPFFGGPPGGRPGAVGAGDRTLAPVIMREADANRDGRIAPEEFTGLAERWFLAWDAERAGRLDEGRLRAGLDQIRNPAGEGIATMLLGAEGKRNGIAATFGIEFDFVHGDLEFEGRVFRDVAVRYKGNGTFLEARDSLKRSLKIDLNKYVQGQSLGDVITMTLQNNVTDASLMNEVLALRLYRDAGVPAPRTAYARVFVTVPGTYERKYFGLYSMVEAVDKKFAERHFGTKRGALFKPVTPSLFTDLGADWAAYQQIYDPKVDLSEEHRNAVMALSRFVSQAEDPGFAARIGEFIDLPELARFLAVMVYLSDLDGLLGPGQNLYLHWHPEQRRFQFIPWDQDRSWGQFNRASQEQRDQLSIHRPWQGDNHFLERMFKVEAFKKLYLARLDEFSRSLFNPERIAQQVEEIAAAIRPAVAEESPSMLARFDKVVAGEVLSSPGPFGGSLIKPIKPFAKVRTQSVLDQLAGRSQGLVAGGGFPGSLRPGGGLGTMFGRPLFQRLDANQDAAVTQTECLAGFAKLFEAWNSDGSGSLTLAQVRSGIAKDLPLAAQAFGRPRGPARPPGGPNAAPPRNPQPRLDEPVQP